MDLPLSLARALLFFAAAAMSLPKKLLVPTDFGEGSQSALDEAIELAKAFGAEILLLHAYEIPVVGFPDGALVATADLASRITDGAREGLDRLIAANEGCGVKITGIIKQGDPWRMIDEAIANRLKSLAGEYEQRAALAAYAEADKT